MTVPHHATNSGKQAIFFAGLYVVLVAALICALIPLNAFSVEFGEADEAAHLVTGVMMYDFLHTGLWQGQSPMGFIQSYYDHYPKVALGHWPPVMYVLEAVWFTIAGLSRISAALFPVLASASLGLGTAALCLREGLPRWRAALAALTLVLLPQTIISTLYVHSDGLTATMILMAAFSAERWVRRWDVASGVRFGAWAAAAVLTKGTAFALAPAVGFATWWKRGWRVLAQPVFWVPIAVVTAVALPWYTVSWNYVSGEIVPGQTVSLPARILYSLRTNALDLVHLASWPAALFTLYSFRTGWPRRLPVMAALLPGLVIFLGAMSPHTETRLLLAAAAVLVFASLLAVRDWHPAFTPAVLILLLGFAHWRQPVLAKTGEGFVAAAAWARTNAPQDAVFLVSAGTFGEGAWISELALAQPHPLARNVRASKVFVSSTWMGGNLKMLVDDPTTVAAVLAEQEIDYVIYRGANAPYEAWLKAALSNWTQVGEFDRVRIYRAPSL